MLALTIASLLVAIAALWYARRATLHAKEQAAVAEESLRLTRLEHEERRSTRPSIVIAVLPGSTIDDETKKPHQVSRNFRVVLENEGRLTAADVVLSIAVRDERVLFGPSYDERGKWLERPVYRRSAWVLRGLTLHSLAPPLEFSFRATTQSPRVREFTVSVEVTGHPAGPWGSDTTLRL